MMREWTYEDSKLFFLDMGVRLGELGRRDLALGCLIYSYVLAEKTEDHTRQRLLAQALPREDLEGAYDRLGSEVEGICAELYDKAKEFGEGPEFIRRRNDYLVECIRDTLAEHPRENPHFAAHPN